MDGRAYYKLSDGKLIGVSNRTDRNIFETKEDFEKKDKIIVLIGQVLREFA